MVILLLVFLGLTFAFGLVLRSQIANVAIGVGYEVAASWNDFRNHVWPNVRRTANGLLIPFGILWLVGFILMICIGSYANSLGSAMVLFFLMPVWLFVFIMPAMIGGIWIIGPAIKLARGILSPIMAVAFLYLFIGLWSPAIKASLDRSAFNLKQTIANYFDKGSIVSEPESGIKAKINQETVVYDEKSMPFPNYKAESGLQVEVVNLNNEVHNMFLVRLPNKNGDITARSSEVYVPRNKVTLLNP
jgi:hypothetical protein